MSIKLWLLVNKSMFNVECLFAGLMLFVAIEFQ